MTTSSGEPGRPRDFHDFYGEQLTDAVRLAYLLTSSREDAHDIAQDAFLGMFRHWSEIREPEGYLRRSIVNGSTKVFRDRDANRSKAVRSRGRTVSEAEDEATVLADLVSRLPGRQRAVVVLKYYLDLREHDIAEAVGMRPGSIGPTLQRAMRQLRKELPDGA